MKKIILTILVALVCLNLTHAQEEYKTSIYFNHDEHQLNRRSKLKLDSFIASLPNKEFSSVNISGFTDSDGSSIYNNVLSERRSLSAYKYLKMKNIPVNSIRTHSFGETMLINNSITEEEKKVNRRVDITAVIKVSDFEEFINQLVPETQTFSIDPTKDNCIKITKRGTVLTIPKNSIVDKNGRAINDFVRIHFQEFTHSADMVFAGIPMKYGKDWENKRLNSSGMFKLTASSNGKEVHIKKGKSLSIDYALARQNPDLAFLKLNEENQWVKIQDIQPLSSNTIKEEEWDEPDLRNSDATFEIRKVKPRKFAKILNANNFKFTDINSVTNINPDSLRPSTTLLAAGADAGHTYPDIIRGLNVSSFGVYNCDQIYQVKNTTTLQPKFVDSRGNLISGIKVISLVDLEFNGAFSFTPNQLVFNNGSKNVVILVSRDKKLYFVDHKSFVNRKHIRSNEYMFRAKDLSETIKSTADLKKLLDQNREKSIVQVSQ